MSVHAFAGEAEWAALHCVSATCSLATMEVASLPSSHQRVRVLLQVRLNGQPWKECHQHGPIGSEGLHRTALSAGSYCSLKGGFKTGTATCSSASSGTLLPVSKCISRCQPALLVVCQQTLLTKRPGLNSELVRSSLRLISEPPVC